MEILLAITLFIENYMIRIFLAMKDGLSDRAKFDGDKILNSTAWHIPGFCGRDIPILINLIIISVALNLGLWSPLLIAVTGITDKYLHQAVYKLFEGNVQEVDSWQIWKDLAWFNQLLKFDK